MSYKGIATKMPDQKILDLPSSIQVKILRGKSCFIAELPEYDISTEADSVEAIVNNVNDLIYAYFDVPKSMQKDFRYCPPQKVEPNTERVKMPLLLVYQQYLDRNCFGFK